MKPVTIPLLVIVILFLNGCMYRHVSVNYDKKSNLEGFKTFAWVPEKEPASDSSRRNDFVRDNAVNYINHALFLRGYRLDTLKPGFLVDLRLLDQNRQRIEITSAPAVGNKAKGSYPYYNYGHSSSHYTYEGPYSEDYANDTVKVNYLHRTITLRLIDQSTRKTLWTGTTAGDIYDPRHADKHIHPGIQRIMRKYPVEPVVRKIKF